MIAVHPSDNIAGFVRIFWVAKAAISIERACPDILFDDIGYSTIKQPQLPLCAGSSSSSRSACSAVHIIFSARLYP